MIGLYQIVQSLQMFSNTEASFEEPDISPSPGWSGDGVVVRKHRTAWKSFYIWLWNEENILFIIMYLNHPFGPQKSNLLPLQKSRQCRSPCWGSDPDRQTCLRPPGGVVQALQGATDLQPSSILCISAVSVVKIERYNFYLGSWNGFLSGIWYENLTPVTSSPSITTCIQNLLADNL